MQTNPAYEDAGLFKNTTSPLKVELVPQLHRNARQDLVVRGFINGHQIDVIFAGRRVAQAAPLEAQLAAMISQARRQALGNGTMPEVDTLRLPTRIEGAFRPKFVRDAAGCETRSYHFMAARWTMIDSTGNIDVYGAAPLVKVNK